MGIQALLSDPTAFLIQLLYRLPCVLAALSVHEAAHAFAAWKLGDETQKYRGRISLNPFHHIDPIGFLLMVLVGFGWAKPVSVNARYFKNPKKGMALTAIAGPAANILLMIIACLLSVAFAVPAALTEGLVQTTCDVLSTFFLILAYMNAGLGLFNLIPIPPLDGSRVLTLFLPNNTYYRLMQYERYGFYILLGILLLGNYFPALDFIGNGLSAGVDFLVGGCWDIFAGIANFFLA